MNQPVPTGPDMFGFAEASYEKARAAGQSEGNRTYGSPEELYQFNAAEHHRSQALTAAVVMLTEVVANASGVDHLDLDAWRQKIGLTWRKACTSMSVRRPACTEWHTEDCHFSDPKIPAGTRVARKKARPGKPHGTVSEQRRLPDGKYRLLVQWDGAEEAWIWQDETVIVRHEKLPVGTRVLVNDKMTRDTYSVTFDGQPWTGRIDGYAENQGCYLIVHEWSPGEYGDHPSYVYMDERVRVHPDGPACPPKPQRKPVKEELSGPRMFVQRLNGQQGHIVSSYTAENDTHWITVHWYTPGAGDTKVPLQSVKIISPDEVQRCDYGQTRDECEEGENRCELCLAAEEAEYEDIEKSMGA